MSRVILVAIDVSLSVSIFDRENLDRVPQMEKLELFRECSSRKREPRRECVDGKDFSGISMIIKLIISDRGLLNKILVVVLTLPCETLRIVRH